MGMSETCFGCQPQIVRLLENVSKRERGRVKRNSCNLHGVSRPKVEVANIRVIEVSDL